MGHSSKGSCGKSPYATQQAWVTFSLYLYLALILGQEECVCAYVPARLPVSVQLVLKLTGYLIGGGQLKNEVEAVAKDRR